MIMAMTASRKHEKDKSTNNDLQNTAHKQTKDWVRRIPLNNGVKSGYKSVDIW
jgi:hypothetical protein